MLDTPTSQGIIVNLLKSQVILALFIFSAVDLGHFYLCLIETLSLTFDTVDLTKCEYLVSL